MHKKKMKNIYKSALWKAWIATFCIFSFLFARCEDDTTENATRVSYNPANPIKITSFSPDSGRVATQMLIDGENFGGHKDSIKVEVNGKNAAVIGVNPEGTLIYCLVPSLKEAGEKRQDGEKIKATVKVSVGESVSNVLENFVYTFSQNVSTFLGFTDQDGNSAFKDGTFEEAQFLSPFWLAFDSDENGPKDENGETKKNIYLIEENNGLRFIDMYDKTVKTVFTTQGNLGRPRTIAFTLDHDTMIIANDAGDWNQNGTIILVRDSASREFNPKQIPEPWVAVMKHKQCNGGAIHPKSGDYWFNSYSKSQVYKVFQRDKIPWRYGGPNASDLNEDEKEGNKYFFLVQDDGWEFNIQIAPSGDFAYIVSKNQHYIARMEYDWTKGIFQKPQPFVGSQKRAGFKDGVGTGSTFFWEPQQGAFDENDNFYVADGVNHCIRKITPQGQVSTFAGRPQAKGYSDGALRDAQFSFPFGIIYDSEIQTYYIADRDNRRIRSIKIE